jgi:hypothetical protein
MFSDRDAGRPDFRCLEVIFTIDKSCRIGSLCGNRQREVFRRLVGYIRFGRSQTSLGLRLDGSRTQYVGNGCRNARPANWSCSYFVRLCYNFGPFVSSGLFYRLADTSRQRLATEIHRRTDAMALDVCTNPLTRREAPRVPEHRLRRRHDVGASDVGRGGCLLGNDGRVPCPARVPSWESLRLA